MSLRINNNIASINGHRNLLQNNMAVSKSLEKLSSGLRINRAADDAAGLVISEQMRAQITGLNQAIDNSETAVSMVQTAEGALNEINSLLNKARELVLHAANEGANDVNQLVADQTELDNVIESVSRIADFTQFGTKKLLDGSLDGSSSLGSGLARVNVGNLANNSAITTGNVDVSITAGASEANTLKGVASTGSDLAYIFSTGGTNTGTAMGSETIRSGVSVSLTVGDVTVSFTSGAGGESASDIASVLDTKLNAVSGGFGVTAESDGSFKVTRDNGGSTDFDASIAFSRGARSAVTEVAESVTADVTLVSTGLSNGAGAAAAIFSGGTALSGISTSAVVNSGTVFTVNVVTESGAIAAVTHTASASGDSLELVMTELLSGVRAASTGFGTGSTLTLVSNGLSSGMQFALARDDGNTSDDFTFEMRIDAVNGSGGSNRIEVINTDNFDFASTGAGNATTGNSTFISTSGATRSGGEDLESDDVMLSGSTINVTINGATVSYVSTGGSLSDAIAGINAQLTDFELAYLTGGAAIGTGLGGNFADAGTGSTSSGEFLVATTSNTNTDFSLAISFDQAVGGDASSSTTSVINAGASADATFNLDTTNQTRTNNTAGVAAHAAETINNASGSTVNTAGSDVTATLTTSNGVSLNLEQTSITTSGAATLSLTAASQAQGYEDISIELTTGATLAGGGSSFTLDNGAEFQVGANDGQKTGLTIRSIDTDELGRNVDGAGSLLSLADLVSTEQSALTSGLTDEAIKIIDAAIDEVTNLRGDLGAFQANTLESGLNSLRVANENLTSAESTIRDVDFAKESAEFTKNNILIQSATAMLAQANQLPQGVLQLLG